MPAVHTSSTEDSVKTLTLFLNDVVEQMLQDFQGHDLKTKDESYVEGPVMSIAMVDAWVTKVVQCSVEKKKPESHIQENNKDSNKEINWECYGTFEALIFGEVTVTED